MKIDIDEKAFELWKDNLARIQPMIGKHLDKALETGERGDSFTMAYMLIQITNLLSEYDDEWLEEIA